MKSFLANLVTGVAILCGVLTFNAYANENSFVEVAPNTSISLNEADVEQLTQLKGIGEKRAIAIIAYREKVGRFESIEQLLSVKGIGEKVLSDNKANIRL